MYSGGSNEEHDGIISLDKDKITSWNDENEIDFVIDNEEIANIDVKTILEDTIEKFSLNRKQKVAFKLITGNVVKRLRKESVQQIIAYIGGPGGTGKSQVIKAVVHFHERIKLRHTLRLCAYTGTAAKLIGGSTISSIAMIRNANVSKLEKIWGSVDTILQDEVSMTGCRLMAKFSRNITLAKHASPNLPFGGVDMFFFGNFAQFPPVLDTPLYKLYNQYDGDIKVCTSQSDILKQLGMTLWKQLTHIVLLTEQMRVTDKVYQELFNRLRDGKSTMNNFIVLSSRVVGNSLSMGSISMNDPIVVPGNKLRREMNNLFITRYSTFCKVFVSKATDSCKRGKLSDEHKEIMKTLPCTQNDGLSGELPLSECQCF